MDVPELPPVMAGRSALAAFLPLEAWARGQAAAARAQAKARVTQARAEAEAIRSGGEKELQEAALQGEREAVGEVKDRARERISAARRAVDAWINESEGTIEEALARALELICGSD